MSIHDEIKARVSERRLFPLEPFMPDDPIARTLVISREIHDLIAGPWKNIAMERRCEKLRADLEVFVTGGPISMCFTPFEARSAYIGLLDPPRAGIWDIRSRDPSPAMRVFGSFVDTDVFAALTWAPRSVKMPWSPSLPLGDRRSEQWKIAIRGCKAAWRRLLAPYKPHKGESVRDYISENAFSI